MVEDLSCEESQITILNRPLICPFCEHDVFIPYTTYRNVEKPGIDVFHVNYTAVCTHCGGVIQFVDPSYFNREGVYVWAFEQTLLHARPPEPPVIRIVDEVTLHAQKQCLHLALRLLVQEKNVVDTVLSLAEEEQYCKVIALLESKTCQFVDEINAEKCLASALHQLMMHRIVDSNQLLSTVINESYPGIEPFLKQYIK
ncbi:hypothetical protein AM499_17445 [Bacillus sp. FJAT-22090]|uniref:hypothetical protein n=1 Tax=Bacillus sp. FJAT-22090 TaxID=1581038 RepID=UPI0006AF42F7|nr:hypothetical protein [Bacillus sp. FJAT-22090]ALC87400.1 hypothetical protein AM499_17445 [Bacillus sp. FJAT-22090]